MYVKACQQQWQIQDFLRGEGVPTPDFAKFSQKLHGIERIRSARQEVTSCKDYPPPVDRQIRAKILPCPKLRFWAVSRLG